jgi:dienelactone hydrolase
MYDDHVYYRQIYASMQAEFCFTATSAAELVEWQARFRPRLGEALGLARMEQDLAGHCPTAERLASQDMGDHVRERWQIWVEPAVPLPFYLLRPKDVKGLLPLVLTPHGHNHPYIYVGIYESEEERRSMAEGERDIAVQAVREGYLVIAPTTRGFGDTRTAEDRRENRLHSCRTQLMHGLLVGRTPIGERVWDIARLLDWALANLDVDRQRIAITGNSGGGTTALHAAACDRRIAVAVPSCYFCTYEGSIGSIRHCDCNYIPGILRLGEMYDVAGLIAPRPFCAIAGREDPIFPIQHVEASFARLQQIYQVADAADRCALYIGEGGHRYYAAGAWPFIRRHFQR